MAVFTVIDHEEATGDLTEWDVTGISQSYDHLLIKASLRSTKAAVYDTGYTMHLNGSTTYLDYRVTTLDASTTTVVSTQPALTSELEGGRIPAANAEAGAFAAVTVWIPNYTEDTNFKQVLINQVFPNTSTTDNEWQMSMRAALVKQDAVAEVTMRRYDSPFAQYSSWTLYGIKGV